MKFALINDNKIVEIRLVESESELFPFLRDYQNIIEITDLSPEPQVHWLLSGSELVNPQLFATSEDQDLYQQQAQRKKGELLCKEAVDLLGARNLKLARESVSVDVALLAQQMASLKILMEGGALKTVRGLCAAMKNSHPNHADILQSIIDNITTFLVKNNWN